MKIKLSTIERDMGVSLEMMNMSQIMNAVDDFMFDAPATGRYNVKIMSKEQKNREHCSKIE